MKPTTIDHDELLQRKADIARRRLMNTVDELDARKNEIEEEVKTVAASASLVPYIAAGAGALVVMTFASGGLRKWNAKRRRRAIVRRIAKALHVRLP